MKHDPYLNATRFKIEKDEHKSINKVLQKLIASDYTTFGDIGCGNGELINYLIGKFPELHFSGFDLNKDYITVAENYPKLAKAS
jgi:trans-aconitate methyltransferase